MKQESPSHSKSSADFAKQFKQIINDPKDIYLVDVLEQLHLLMDSNEDQQALLSFLKRSKQNLLIKSKRSPVQHSLEFCQNLYTTLIAILNIDGPVGSIEFNDENFKYYIYGINFNRDDDDLIIIDQVSTIKSLINRPSYYFTHKQKLEI